MKYIALLLTLFIFTSCELIFPDPPEPELPPITTTGENTFGAIVNGEIRTTSSSFFITALHPRDSILQISGELRDGDSRFIIGFGLNRDAAAVKEYNSTFGNAFFVFNNIDDCVLDSGTDNDVIYEGKFEIIHLDPINQIMSGTFEYTISKQGCSEIKVTDGRFDVRYRI